MFKQNMDKWIYRQNARRKMQFGIHEAVTRLNPGESVMRHYAIHNPNHAKAMVRDVIECIRLMRSDRFKEHLATMNAKALEFYRGAA